MSRFFRAWLSRRGIMPPSDAALDGLERMYAEGIELMRTAPTEEVRSLMHAKLDCLGTILAQHQRKVPPPNSVMQ